MILDLIGLDAEEGPVSRRVRVVDVAPLDLVRAERGPPDALRCAGECECDALGDHGRARRRVVCERGDELEEELVRVRRWARKRKRALECRHADQVGERLRDVHHLRENVS